jgi:hypothetical protein
VVVPEAVWALANELATPKHCSAAREALTGLATRGWPTALETTPTVPQFLALTARQRLGLRRLWEEAVRRGQRTQPIPTRAAYAEVGPPHIDAAAWALTMVRTTAAKRASAWNARGALKALAARGLRTDLDATLTREQISALSKEHRLALWKLWCDARERGLRVAPLPPGMIEIEGRPPEVDEVVWNLATQLRGSRAKEAQIALRALAFAGQPTALDVALPTRVFVTLQSNARWALRRLWEEAIARGLPVAAQPDLLSEWLYRQDLEGVDRDAVAMVRRVCKTTHSQPAWIWLRELRNAGVPTDLNVDLEAPAMRALLDVLLNKAAHRELYGGTSQLGDFRGMLRRLYAAASAAGLRTRPLPGMLSVGAKHRKGSGAALEARLPSEDRARLQRVVAHLRELARRQQGGRMLRAPTPKGEMRPTESQSNGKVKLNALRSFLHHAAEWELDDLRNDPTLASDPERTSPWRIENGLTALLTPANVARWAYQGHKSDGSPKKPNTSTRHHWALVRLLERAAKAGHPLVPSARISAIAEELNRFRVEEEWNVAPEDSLGGGDADDFEETGKWFPTLEQLRTGIARLHQRYEDAKIAREQHGAFKEFWRATRDFVLAYSAFICMWRVDTAATIDLSRLARDPQTRQIRWRDGSIHVRSGARAKQSGNRSYYVKDLLIPGEVVDLIEILLTLEGRSLEHPLRPGEAIVELAVGDNWGGDELLDEARTVIPLFRREPDAPAALQYSGAQKSLARSLLAMHWDAINAHTMRAAGAIEWRFVRGRSLAAIMRLGLWSREETLNRCYAHLSNEDLDNEIARGAPAMAARATSGSAQLMGALDEAQKKAIELRLKPNPTAFELSAAARVLRSTAKALSHAAGEAAAEPLLSKFREAADYQRVDAALRPLYAGGLSQLLGFEVLPDMKAKRATPPRSDRRMLVRLREEMARSARTPTRAPTTRRSA